MEVIKYPKKIFQRNLILQKLSAKNQIKVTKKVCMELTQNLIINTKNFRRE